MKLAVTTATPELAKAPPVALLLGTFEERLRKARLFGYDGLELMVGQPATLHPAALRRQMAAEGLAAAAIASGAQASTQGLTLVHMDPAQRQAALLRLRDMIELAEALGAPTVTIGSFRGRLANGGAQGMEMLLDALATGAEWAGQHGVMLGLEAGNRYELDWGATGAEILEVIRAVGSPHIGVLLDTFHVNIEEASLAGAVEQAMVDERLAHVHLGDSNRHAAGWGHFDWQTFLDALRRHGYSGWLSAELFPVPDADEAARQTAAFMRPLLG